MSPHSSPGEDQRPDPGDGGNRAYCKSCKASSQAFSSNAFFGDVTETNGRTTWHVIRTHRPRVWARLHQFHPHACVFFDLVGFVFEHHEWCLEYFPAGAFEYFYCIVSTSCYFIYTVPKGLLEKKKDIQSKFLQRVKIPRNSKAW